VPVAVVAVVAAATTTTTTTPPMPERHAARLDGILRSRVMAAVSSASPRLASGMD
jgi:hypothetical protein